MNNADAPTPFGMPNGHPNYKTNLHKVESTPFGRPGHGASQTDCCSFCGKLCRTPKFWGYHEDGGSYDVAPADPDVTGEEGHVGFYPLGSDCARKLKAQGVPVYNAKFARIS